MRNALMLYRPVLHSHIVTESLVAKTKGDWYARRQKDVESVNLAMPVIQPIIIEFATHLLLRVVFLVLSVPPRRLLTALQGTEGQTCTRIQATGYVTVNILY